MHLDEVILGRAGALLGAQLAAARQRWRRRSVHRDAGAAGPRTRVRPLRITVPRSPLLHQRLVCGWLPLFRHHTAWPCALPTVACRHASRVCGATARVRVSRHAGGGRHGVCGLCVVRGVCSFGGCGWCCRLLPSSHPHTRPPTHLTVDGRVCAPSLAHHARRCVTQGAKAVVRRGSVGRIAI
jgi:hypothetical protein